MMTCCETPAFLHLLLSSHAKRIRAHLNRVIEERKESSDHRETNEVIFPSKTFHYSITKLLQN